MPEARCSPDPPAGAVGTSVAQEESGCTVGLCQALRWKAVGAGRSWQEDLFICSLSDSPFLLPVVCIDHDETCS